MDSQVEPTPAMSLEEKIALLEKRLAELELLNKVTPLTEAALALNDAADKKKAEEKEKEKGKGSVVGAVEDKKNDDGTPASRMKVVIVTRDQDGALVEQEKEVKSKDDVNQFAFVLRKIGPNNKFQSQQFPDYSEIDIISKDLWGLLKEYLGWYPYHLFRGDPVTMTSPYEAVVFKYEELRDEAAKAEEDEAKKQVRTDLKLLLDTISTSSGDERLDKYFKTRPNYKKQKEQCAGDTIQFDDLWTVFPPGTLVYGKPFQGEDQVFVVKDNRSCWSYKEVGMRNPPPWELEAWSYDWAEGSFQRTLFILPFEHFDGHRPLTALPFYPFELHPDHEKIYKSLVQRGKRFREICTKKNDSCLFDYEGSSILEHKGFSGMKTDEDGENSDVRSFSNYDFNEYFGNFGLPRGRFDTEISKTTSIHIQSRVMVDYDAFFQYGRADGRNGALKSSSGGNGCVCYDCQGNKRLGALYRMDFDKNEKPGSTWEDEKYLICPPRVLGYILREKQWAQLEVNKLKSPEKENQDSAWKSRLKLADDVDEDDDEDEDSKDNTTKSLLFDLVSTHLSTKPQDRKKTDKDRLEVDDIVKGKGKGLIILLYGPPGVGKTSTAETIAVATQKPLFSISVADVGTKAKHVEANLQRVFDLATKWQAILLIDEADVFLESRGRKSAIRSTDQNALVSVFLRVLEYYQGIMFLTTNQVADFDIAIPSRIHIAICYKTLNKKQKKLIFTGFLDKLAKQNLIENYGEIKEYLRDDVYRVDLDGRQIRNIVSTALGLARADKYCSKLKKEHLRRAFVNVRDFKEDFRVQMQRYKDSQEKMIK